MRDFELVSFIVGVVVCMITAIVCGTYYSISQTQAIKSNIESAIVKGIDPISVRCAYGSNSDNVCVAYAVSHGKDLQPKK